MILYRPVGLQELELIYDGGMKAFPARLPQQPIFYPVLDLEYARQTALDWNAKSGQFAGYVTQFKVDDEYLDRFEKHTVGRSKYLEFWIPTEELEEFNRHIVGHIKVLEAHFGNAFQGFVPDKFGLQGKNAVAQFTELANIFVYKRMEFYLEIKRNHKAIFLNYPFWLEHEFKNQGLKEKVLQGIKEAWLTSFPKTPLPNPIQEENTPVKQAEIPAPQNSTPEENSLVRPHRPPAQGKPADENGQGTKQAEPRSPVKPAPEDLLPIKPAYSFSFTNNVAKDPPPAKQAESPSLTNPVKENIPAAKPTVSHFSQGIELGLSGNYQEAVSELTQSVQGNPRHVVAQTSLGVAFRRLGQEDRALSCYEAAIKLDPRSAEARYFRANILYSRGNVREAITEYTTAIGLKPELIEAHQQPVPQDRLTDYSDAPAGIYRVARHAFRLLDLNKLIETSPRQANLYKERASEYSRLGNHEQAIADYDSYLAIQPDDANVLHLRGLAYEQIGQPERSLKDYQQAIVSDPQLSDEYINRGITFGKMGNFRQSVDSLTEGIRLAPGNPNGYFNRGMTYVQLGDFESAIADFSMVIQLSSNDEDAYYWRGICHEELGHLQEAAADYKHFLSLSQNPRARQEIEQKLSQWQEEKDNRSKGSQLVAPEDKHKAVQFSPEDPGQNLDLHELLLALGERAVQSTWFGQDVDCTGEKAEELFAFTDNNRAMQGGDFLAITSGIHKTFEGDFTAFDPDAISHWLLIRAWHGTGFYIEIDDPGSMKRLRTHFRSAEEVEDTPSPYKGLFIPS